MSKLEELKKQKADIEAEIKRMEKDVTVSDPIYLLSVEEFKKYRDRIPEWNLWCWLRTPTPHQDYVASVCGCKLFNCSGDFISNNSGCVRPVLNEANMNEEDKSFHIFDRRMTFCGATWVKLDDGLWIAELPIATRRFDEESNDYSRSEIRRFLLDWYEERRKW